MSCEWFSATFDVIQSTVTRVWHLFCQDIPWIDYFTQAWYNLAQTSPKAFNYRLNKEELEFENYFEIKEC